MCWSGEGLGRGVVDCWASPSWDQVVSQFLCQGKSRVWAWGFRSLLTLSKMGFVFLSFIFLVGFWLIFKRRRRWEHALVILKRKSLVNFLVFPKARRLARKTGAPVEESQFTKRCEFVYVCVYFQDCVTINDSHTTSIMSNYRVSFSWENSLAHSTDLS